MESLRQSLTGDFLKRIEKELGREVTVRLLWSSIVGPRLAGCTQVKGVRRNTLLISVSDGSWLGPLESMNRDVLDAVNRTGIGKAFDSIEFFADLQPGPHLVAPKQEAAVAYQAASDLLESEAASISDENLRKMFLASAGKYCRPRPR